MSALRVHPKQWLAQLLDGNSDWVELTPALSADEVISGDEVVTGIGKVSGKKVGVIAHNNLVDNGYITSCGAQKILKLMDRCAESGLPILSLMASPGVSIKEGILAGDGYARILRRTCELSGQVPQIAGIMGVNVGGPAYSATLQDLAVFNRLRSHMMVSAPNVVRSVLGQDSTLGELGGSRTHSEITGLAHFVEDSVKNQIVKIRELVDFFPRHYLQDPAVRSPREPIAQYQLPVDPAQPFSMREYLESFLDRGGCHYYLPNFGDSVIAVWGYLKGLPVGVVANNPESLAGSLNVESSEKSARFIRLSDSFNIPIITLVDTPGFMPGVKEEHGGLLKSGARLCRAMQTRVPRVSVVLRKNYGAAAIVLTQTQGWGGDLVLALEGSSCAIMGFDAAEQAIYGLHDFSEDKRSELKKRYKNDYEDPRQAYRQGFIDVIVKEKDLREVLFQHLALLIEKRPKPGSPVRGIEP